MNHKPVLTTTIKPKTRTFAKVYIGISLGLFTAVVLGLVYLFTNQ